MKEHPSQPSLHPLRRIAHPDVPHPAYSLFAPGGLSNALIRGSYRRPGPDGPDRTLENATRAYFDTVPLGQAYKQRHTSPDGQVIYPPQGDPDRALHLLEVRIFENTMTALDKAGLTPDDFPALQQIIYQALETQTAVPLQHRNHVEKLLSAFQKIVHS